MRPRSRPMFGNVEVSENTATQSISMFTTYLLAGPANEMCQNPGPYCMKQKMAFRVLDIDNPTLFAVQPQVSVDDNYLTRLIFDVTPGATGTAKITYFFEDDGRSAASLPSNVLSTATSTFRVKVFATNDPPSFQLPFAVSSLTCAADMPSSSLCPSAPARRQPMFLFADSAINKMPSRRRCR